MRFVQAAFVAAFLVSGFAGHAKADYFVWEDAKSGLTLSYPDTWRMVSTRDTDEVLAIMAPSKDKADAICHVRVRSDKRFLIYPPHLGRDVQTISYSKEFWEEYLGEYDNVEIYGTNDGGLGRGYGSFAVAGYDGTSSGPMGKRRGIMAASLYFDKAYIVDCSARAATFEEFQPLFLSVMGSVDFKKTHDELWSGDYRNFFADPRFEFKWPDSKAVLRY